MAEALRIYEDQENRVPGVGLKPKRVGLRLLSNNGQPNQQRTAFGNLSSSQNTTNLRIQPSRTAKQTAPFDGGPVKYSQDENAYARTKSFSSTTSSSALSLSVYSDDSSNVSKSSKNNSNASRDSSVETVKVSTESTVDKTSLQYAASKLGEQLSSTFSALPRSQATLSGGSGVEELMELSNADESSTTDMSVATPCRPQEELLRAREESMWDMSEYAADIYLYLREAEKVHRPRLNYMDKQTDISVSMRWILVDWMVEVAEEYNLSTETLYLAVSYIDRFLSHMSVKRDKLQLVGTTAMFIASKYEEIYPPDVSQFAYITDNTYKVSHILRMEHLILKVLSFDMAVPTAFVFINKFSRTLGCTDATTCLALFIAELTMLDCDPFLRFLPSEIAATALAIANFMQGLTPWPAIMTEKYIYKLEDLRECYVNLNRTLSKVHESSQHAIREKYKNPKMHGVSSMKPRTELPF
ncbi:Cyclin N-terminal [Trinorchestia longiramus]|nr:Cyclin N-terminal [Trinorchestia longiramus]